MSPPHSSESGHDKHVSVAFSTFFLQTAKEIRTCIHGTRSNLHLVDSTGSPCVIHPSAPPTLELSKQRLPN